MGFVLRRPGWLYRIDQGWIRDINEAVVYPTVRALNIEYDYLVVRMPGLGPFERLVYNQGKTVAYREEIDAPARVDFYCLDCSVGFETSLTPMKVAKLERACTMCGKTLAEVASPNGFGY